MNVTVLSISCLAFRNLSRRVRESAKHFGVRPHTRSHAHHTWSHAYISVTAHDNRHADKDKDNQAKQIYPLHHLYSYIRYVCRSDKPFVSKYWWQKHNVFIWGYLANAEGISKCLRVFDWGYVLNNLYIHIAQSFSKYPQFPQMYLLVGLAYSIAHLPSV